MDSSNLPPVTLFTFFLELPRALPLPPDYVTVSGEEGDEHWDGWSDHAVAQILSPGSESPLPAGFVPATHVAVRHIEVSDVPPTVLAEEAFADWVDGLLPESANERQADRQAWASSGIPVVRSVVALSRFLPRSAHPQGSDMTIGWLHSQFQTALKDLNDFLETLGFVMERWEVGPLALRDLPARIPVLIGSTDPLPNDRPRGILLTAQIHEALPALVGEFTDEQQAAEEAIELNNRAHHNEQPYMLVFQFVRAAETERLAGDPARAVIDLNTAVEIFVWVTLTAGGELVGAAVEEVELGNQAGVKKKVRKHLAELLGKEIDIDDPATVWGRWFGDGYKLRNRAIHEGASLDDDAVARAFAQASAVFLEVKDDLEASEPLKRLGQLLEFEAPRTTDTREDEPLGIEFPWD
ncbi:MAG TPA: hypothetical protein VIS95_06705 [Solirubrobacterales bacterium]